MYIIYTCVYYVCNFCHEGFTFHVGTGYVAVVIAQRDLHAPNLRPHPQAPLPSGQGASRSRGGGAWGRLGGGGCRGERSRKCMEEWRSSGGEREGTEHELLLIYMYIHMYM